MAQDRGLRPLQRALNWVYSTAMSKDSAPPAAERGPSLPDDNTWQYRAGRRIPANREDQVKWAALLFDEFKYRHDRYWRIFELFSGAAVVVGIVPWVKTDLLALGGFVLLFPAISLFLALAAAILLHAEAQRMLAEEDLRLAIRQQLGSVAFRLLNSEARPVCLTRLARINVGSAVSWFLFLMFVAGNFINGAFLYSRLPRDQTINATQPAAATANATRFS